MLPCFVCLLIVLAAELAGTKKYWKLAGLGSWLYARIASSRPGVSSFARLPYTLQVLCLGHSMNFLPWSRASWTLCHSRISHSIFLPQKVSKAIAPTRHVLAKLLTFAGKVSLPACVSTSVRSVLYASLTAPCRVGTLIFLIFLRSARPFSRKPC